MISIAYHNNNHVEQCLIIAFKLCHSDTDTDKDLFCQQIIITITYICSINSHKYIHALSNGEPYLNINMSIVHVYHPSKLGDF